MAEEKTRRYEEAGLGQEEFSTSIIVRASPAVVGGTWTANRKETARGTQRKKEEEVAAEEDDGAEEDYPEYKHDMESDLRAYQARLHHNLTNDKYGSYH
ncbi:MAG: hypothetical protein Q9174_005520, partial [Haloplaca sp. 1 TL-2023]